jgi:NAD(P)-dependent dehydrogenase (short-subunit alcohol dehydrogenase family)
VADQDLGNAQQVELEIAQSSGRGIALEVDIGDRQSLDAMVSQVLDRFGRIDVLINNAAIFAALQKRPFDEIPLQEWNKVLHVNVTGTFLSICAVTPTMKKAGSGRIITVSSNSVRKGVTNYR